MRASRQQANPAKKSYGPYHTYAFRADDVLHARIMGIVRKTRGRVTKSRVVKDCMNIGLPKLEQRYKLAVETAE